MTPKVSVCMISYRHEAFIAQAIESILAQQCDFDIELVIGDDCSPDRSSAICDEYARRDPRVRLLPRDRNLGVMANFSRTLQACRGQYVAVCEGDDYWIDPLKLAKQVAFLDAHPDHAAATHQARVVREGELPRAFRENVPSTLGARDLIGGRLFHTASVLFRRPIVDTFAAAPTVVVRPPAELLHGVRRQGALQRRTDVRIPAARRWHVLDRDGGAAEAGSGLDPLPQAAQP